MTLFHTLVHFSQHIHKPELYFVYFFIKPLKSKLSIEGFSHFIFFKDFMGPRIRKFSLFFVYEETHFLKPEVFIKEKNPSIGF